MGVLQKVEQPGHEYSMPGETKTREWAMAISGRSTIVLYYTITGTEIDWPVPETLGAALRGEDYPALVAVWDNDIDAIYDTI